MQYAIKSCKFSCSKYKLFVHYRFFCLICIFWIFLHRVLVSRILWFAFHHVINGIVGVTAIKKDDNVKVPFKSSAENMNYRDIYKTINYTNISSFYGWNIIYHFSYEMKSIESLRETWWKIYFWAMYFIKFANRFILLIIIQGMYLNQNL